MKVIVLGAGGATRELLRRLGERWEVMLLDSDAGAIERAVGIREFDHMVGDASSPLVLQRAGIQEADALVAATGDDEVNLAAVKFAEEAGLLRVAAIAADPERVAEYRESGVYVIAPDSLAARNIEVHLEPRRMASTAFADGKAEAIEFLVTPDSSVRGKALRDLHSETWLIAAVLREGALIVPHGHTRIEAGDRVTVVGSAADFSTIVHTFTSGESRFPLAYGRNAIVALGSRDDMDGPVSEALSMVRNSHAASLIVVHPDLATVRDDSLADEIRSALETLGSRSDGVDIEYRPTDAALVDTVRALAGQESVGLVVTSMKRRSVALGRFAVARLLETYGSTGKPLLVARSSHPYTSILVPARRTAAGEAAAWAAIDLAVTSGGALMGVTVVPPSFVQAEGSFDDGRRAAAWLREEAAVQGIHVRRKIRQGNPVRVMEELAATAGLLVLGFPATTPSVLRPGVVGHLLRRVATSVLMVPVGR